MKIKNLSSYEFKQYNVVGVKAQINFAKIDNLQINLHEELSNPKIKNSNAKNILKSLLSSSNISSKEYIFQQYDHQVQTNTIISPGEADASVIQMDEAHLTGHAKDAEWVHEPFNHALNGIQGKKALHLCFGNDGGQSIQKGYWKDLMPFLNKLDVDHLVLEFARRGYDELHEFNELKPEIKLGVGVVDIKDNEVESKDLIARRIENAVKVLGMERIKWIHPDCGFWMLPRSVADRKMAVLVEGRDTFLDI